MRHGRDTTGEQARRRIAEARLRTQLQAIAELARAHTLPAAAPRVLEALCRGLDWQMAALWREIAPGRQLAPKLDADDLARWMNVPGIFYRLARARNGRLAGFLALWDQRQVRRLRAVERGSVPQGFRRRYRARQGTHPLRRAGTHLGQPIFREDDERGLAVQAELVRHLYGRPDDLARAGTLS